MDIIKIVEYIKKLRIKNNLTQQELGEKLNVSFQAVSKWERGLALPDSSILLDLADILGTTTDLLLNGGTLICGKRKQATVKEIINGFEAIETIRQAFGEHSMFYLGIKEGISTKMNFDFEEALIKHREVLYTEAILQAIIFENKMFNMDDIQSYIESEKMLLEIEKAINKYSK
jgi:transcriptional regulator with XRE-family HTH domain